MRVISGIRKGHILKSPKGLNTRPTQDRIKESLFNILGIINNESKVLDLFAGSGSIGIEFLSRGAKECYFIDNSYESIKIIKENLTSTRLDEKAHVYKNNVANALDVLGNKSIDFDYIFMDPPYRKNLVSSALESINNNNLIKKDGIIIVEHEKEFILDEKIFNFIKSDERNYSDKAISFYKKIMF